MKIGVLAIKINIKKNEGSMFFDKECKLIMATLSHMDYLAMIKTKSMDDMKLREYEF